VEIEGEKQKGEGKRRPFQMVESANAKECHHKALCINVQVQY